LESGILQQLVLSSRRVLNQLVDDFITRHAIALGGEVHHDAMPQDRFGTELDIGSIDMGPAR
jgi:hypothetical protein